VVEVRFPAESVDAEMTVPRRREVRDRLGEDWVINDARVAEVVADFTMGPPIREVPATRFMARDRMTSVTLKAGAVIVETTAYPGFSAFSTILSAAFAATQDTVGPDAVTRVGLRYIDEIVVPGMSGQPFSEWRAWLAEPLLPPNPAELEDLGLAHGPWNGFANYAIDPERGLNLRWSHNPGSVVAGDGPLRRPKPPTTSPLFVLDFDSSWTPTDFPPFSSDELVQECETLHRPMHGLFESLITERLREEVFFMRGAQ
jgi:uncharacterized protein (TIGR04255 family)